MSEAELALGSAWVQQHFVFIRAEDDSPTSDWILSTAKAAVSRYGVRGLIIDPYNEIEHHRPRGMSETEYIGQLLGKIKRFAQACECHVRFIAHPTKPDRTRAVRPH